MKRTMLIIIVITLTIAFSACAQMDETVTPDFAAADGKISTESAEAIALEKAKSMAAELAAENIQLDKNKPCELMTLKDTIVWAVRFTYTVQNQPDQPGVYGILVMVDAYSGEIFRVYLS